jgi:hypothetical protein
MRGIGSIVTTSTQQTRPGENHESSTQHQRNKIQCHFAGNFGARLLRSALQNGRWHYSNPHEPKYHNRNLKENVLPSKQISAMARAEKLFKAGERHVADLAKKCGVHYSTIYRAHWYLKYKNSIVKGEKNE